MAAEGTPHHRKTLQVWQRMVYTLKTEWAAVSVIDYHCGNVKQLRSLITIPEDIKWLLQQAAIASRRMHAWWLRKIHASIDRSLYEAFILPTFLYNCCIWRATHSCMDRLDAFNQFNLKKIFIVLIMRVHLLNTHRHIHAFFHFTQH